MRRLTTNLQAKLLHLLHQNRSSVLTNLMAGLLLLALSLVLFPPWLILIGLTFLFHWGVLLMRRDQAMQDAHRRVLMN
jgi:hypothetical protein